MQRARYAISVSVINLVQLAALFWLFAYRVAPGAEAYLPKKDRFNIMAATAAIVFMGVWYISIRLTVPKDTKGLDPVTVLIFCALAFCIASVSVARLTFPLFTTFLGPLSAPPTPLAAGVWLTILYICANTGLILPVFLKHVIPSADDILRSDSRKPVLYFRSYSKEVRRAAIMGYSRLVRDFLRAPQGVYVNLPTDLQVGGRVLMSWVIRSRRNMFDEQMIFANAFNEIGPYIALGRADETFVNVDLGAAKKYVSDDQWREVVQAWLTKCAAVVVEAGDSASLGWEIAQVIRQVPSTSVLVICPHSDTEYEAFVKAHGDLFPTPPPPRRPESRLLVFDEGWNPKQLENVDSDARASLAPFVEQVMRRGAQG